MYLDFDPLSPNQRYHILTQSIIPRPIAWVLSDNGSEASYNLAPFSYFNGVCSDPPLIMLSIGHKPNGDQKDTLVNITERSHFVIHIPHAEQAAMVTESSRSLAHGESELAGTDLTLAEFEHFSLPRLAECPIAMACERYEIQALGNGPQYLILGQVKSVYVDDSVASKDDKGRVSINSHAVDPLARLGGSEYRRQGESIHIPRPK